MKLSRAKFQSSMVMAVDSDTVTLTVRLIRSFEHRNIQHIVYKDVNLSQVTENFKQMVINDLSTRTGIPPPFRKFKYDCLKIQHKAYGAKTSDPVINTERDEELMLKEHLTLAENGIENETELSFFKLEDYLKYKESPKVT